MVEIPFNVNEHAFKKELPSSSELPTADDLNESSADVKGKH